MYIDIIAGTRPNFIKIAAIIKAIKFTNDIKLKYRLIHTGQHYDSNMSDSFFKQLNIPEPEIMLNVGSGSFAEQTSKIMISYEKVLSQSCSDCCMVVGDVTSTMACSIVAKNFGIKVAHVEAGLRSRDMKMPEEINRILTDSITDYYYTTLESANINLINDGIEKNKITYVGNTMIDTLLNYQSKFIKPSIFDELNLKVKKYFVFTLHRPGNVDEINKLEEIINAVLKNTNEFPIIFPVHPRTKKILSNLKIKFNNLFLIDPLSYLEFNYCVKNSFCVITDSGGITEETSAMNIPCLTLRDNTERPETVTLGSNELIGTNTKKYNNFFEKLFSGKWKKAKKIPMWDGKASNRIIKHLKSISNER